MEFVVSIYDQEPTTIEKEAEDRLFLVESASVRSKQGKRKAATHHKLGPQDKPIPPGILHMYAHADHEAIAVKQFQRIGAALVKLIHYDQSDGVRSRKYVL
jgi:hypothetical protein